MTHGHHRRNFWLGVTVGHLAPIALTIIALAADVSDPTLTGLAGIAAIAGMWAYEDAFVRAGQSVPLS